MARNAGPFKIGSRYQVLFVHTETVIATSVVFNPTNAVEIAWLLGMKVADLPDVLQSFTLMSAELGNCILDRIDPVTLALHNPWTKFDFTFRLGLSKRGLKKAAQEKQPVDLAPLNFINACMGRGEPVGE